MRLIDRILVVSVVMLIGGVLMGQSSVRQAIGGPKKGLDAKPLNGAASTLTFKINNAEGYSTVQFWFDYTHTTNGIISLTCTGGPGDSENPGALENDYTLTTCASESAAGECAAQDAGILKSGTANLTTDKKWDGRLGMRGARQLECVADHSGVAVAGDILTVKYSLVAQ